MKRLPVITSFALFIALCVSAAYWAMQFFKPPLRPVAAPAQTVQPAPRLEAATGLFGGRDHAVIASNFQLKGVVVASNPVESVAILAADGKPPQSVRINDAVAPGVTLNEVHSRYVLLSEGGALKRVDLPEVAKLSMNAGSSSKPSASLPVANQPSPARPAPASSAPSPRASARANH